MSTPIIGYGGNVSVGGTQYPVEQWSLTLSNELAEVSDTSGGGNSSAGPWVTRIGGYSSGEATFSIFLTDTGAASTIAAFKQGVTVAASFAVGNITHSFSGNFLVSSCGVSNPAKSPCKLDVSCSSTGAVTFS